MRRILLLLALTSLVGCATSGPSDRTLEWYNTQTKKWVDAIVSSCSATHANYVSGKSPVDCTTNSTLTQLTMSFPDFKTFQDNGAGVGEFLDGWCSSVGAYTGRLPRVKLEFRETKAMAVGKCESQDKKDGA